MQRRKAVNVKHGQKCEKDKKPIDIFSLGHLGLGLTTASVFILVTYFSQEPIKSVVFNAAYYIPLILFIGWELLERTVLKKAVYEKGWEESTINSVMDVVIAEVVFLLYYFIVILNISGEMTIIIASAIPFILDFVFMLLARKCF